MKKIVALGAVVLIGALYFLRGPYFLPTSVALGPCLKDWTSPASYSPRASPLQTLEVDLGDANARLCYGAPSARGRKLFGDLGLVPPGALWRMGANEPTRLFVDGPVRLGDLRLEAGRYSLYAVPDTTDWEVFVTGSTWHWGNMIGGSVRAQELGSFRAPFVRLGTHQEELAFLVDEGALMLSWGFTRVSMPIEALID